MSDAAAGSGHLRKALLTSTDPRAGRTRSRLFQAAQTLSARGDEVSVSAIVREAGVSRSVFYTHFADLSELALRMIEPVFTELAAQAAAARDDDPVRAMRDAHDGLTAHIDAERSLYRAALTLPGNTLREQMREAMLVPLLDHVETVGTPAGLRAELVARYLAGAATTVLADWATGAVEASADEIALHLSALMPAWMHERRDESST